MNEPRQYQKRPVVIDAYLLTEENALDVLAWINSGEPKAQAILVDNGILMPTLEGTHVASFGDFVIRGVKGEHYGCKPDIFALTYMECK